MLHVAKISQDQFVRVHKLLTKTYNFIVNVITVTVVVVHIFFVICCHRVGEISSLSAHKLLIS